ncbi:hypothetical protein DENSPDRAFT_881859 [Dentipellis sp. KUC8613]|nr:hypothetical protein DENSPDRAFT_881859 [Dentipellis sp. KUC8613]
MSSANLNGRSQKDGNSEITLAVENDDLLESTMAGEPVRTYVPKVKTGYVVPGIPLEHVKDCLARVNDCPASCVKGTLVEAPLDFLISWKDFVEVGNA